MDDIRTAIRLLCQQFGELRSKAVSVDDRAELDAIVAAARAGEDIDARRSALVARLGVRFRRRRVIVGLTGLGPGHTTPDVYVCPSGICPRTWLNVPGKGDPPRCGLVDQVMRKG